MQRRRQPMLYPMALAAAIAGAAGCAHAAAATDPGIPAGSFVLYPELTLGLRFDDNIYATPDHRIDDMVLTASPTLEARSGWQRHALNLSAGANIARYQDYSSEDTEDYWLEAKGRYDLSERAGLIAGARHTSSHEDRESADQLAATTPTTYREQMLYGGVQQGFANGLSARLGGSYRRLDYDNVPNALLQTNDDRDRDVFTGALRLGHALAAGYQWFVQAGLDRRRYRLATDDAGYRRDSAGYRVQTGIQWQRGAFSGDAYVGHMTQDYEDARLSDVSSLDFGAGLDWQAASRTTLRMALERSVDETTVSGASSALVTSLSIGLSHQLHAGLDLSGTLGVRRADYQGLPRQDDFAEMALGVKYALSPRSYLAGHYRYLQRDSNDDTVDFDRQQLSLLVGWQF